MANAKTNNDFPKWKRRLHEIIFEADTAAGKAFDIALLIFIVLSVIIVLLDSVPTINSKYGVQLYYSEWFFTIIFTIEYILRIIIFKNKSVIHNYNK